MTHQDATYSTASQKLRGLLFLAVGWLVGVAVRIHGDSSTVLSGLAGDGLSDIGRTREPHPETFFDIVDGFTDVDGDTVLLVKEATVDEETAVSVEELFDAFREVYVFVLPKSAVVERTTRARIAERAGMNLAALADAQREFQMMLNNPGEGHLTKLGEALDSVWD